jgi:hypothetical protein
LDVTLFAEEPGDNDQQNCEGRVEYEHFKAGERYTLVESSLGSTVRASLLDGHGKEVAATQDFNCMPG